MATPEQIQQALAAGYTREEIDAHLARRTTSTPLPTVPPEYRQGGAKAITPGVNPAKLGRELTQESFQQAGNAADRYIAGGGTALSQPAMSIYQLAGGEIDPNTVQAQRDLSNTREGFVGNIAGNVATLGVPLGKAEMAINAATKAGPLVRTLTAGGIGAGEAGLLTPVKEGESRWTNSLVGGAFGTGANVAGRLFGGIVKPSKEALELMLKGIQPTVGQGGSGLIGNVLSKVENVASGLVPAWTRPGQKRAEREAVQVAAERANPYGAQAPKNVEVGSPEYHRQLNANTDQAARDINAVTGNIPLPAGFRQDIRNSVNQLGGNLSPRDRRTVEQHLANLVPPNTPRGGMPAADVAHRVGELDRLALEARNKGNEALANVYQEASNQFRKYRASNVSPELARQIDRVEEAAAHKGIIDFASAHKKNPAEGITMQDLINAVEKKEPDSRRLVGSARLQDITDPGSHVFSKARSNDVFNRAAQYAGAGGLLGLSSGLLGVGHLTDNPYMTFLGLPITAGLVKGGTSRTGAKLAMGNTNVQRAFRDIAEGRMGTISSILTNED